MPRETTKGHLDFLKDSPEEINRKRIKRSDEVLNKFAAEANRRELEEDLAKVTPKQKETILKYFDVYYREFYFKNKSEKFFGDEQSKEWELISEKLDQILNDSVSGFEVDANHNRITGESREVQNAMTAVWRDVKNNPENFSGHQEVVEKALEREMINLWSKYNKPFIFFEIPSITLNEWLTEGKAAEKELIKKYGTVLGEKRISDAIVDSQDRNNDEVDYLAKSFRIYNSKSVLLMSKEEIVNNFHEGKNLPQDYLRWFNAR